MLYGSIIDRSKQGSREKISYSPQDAKDAENYLFSATCLVVLADRRQASAENKLGDFLKIIFAHILEILFQTNSFKSLAYYFAEGDHWFCLIKCPMISCEASIRISLASIKQKILMSARVCGKKLKCGIALSLSRGEVAR